METPNLFWYFHLLFYFIKELQHFFCLSSHFCKLWGRILYFTGNLKELLIIFLGLFPVVEKVNIGVRYIIIGDIGNFIILI